MAQRQYRVELQDPEFPMLSEQQGRTVIGSTSEELYTKGNKPGIGYCHNVMPSKEGLDSVGFIETVPSLAPPGTYEFVDARTIHSASKDRMYVAWNEQGETYVLEPGSSVWFKPPATVPATISPTFSIDSVTLGTVNGITYVFYAGIGAFTYSLATHTFDAVVLTGLSIPDVLGVVASSGYLIAYTEEANAWSSTVDPTDFAPSQVTGAGGGNVAGIGGAILFCLPIPTGFIVYTKTNAIAATYTGNVLYPFKYREVDSSKGGLSLTLVTYEANSKEQFVYSKAGLQSITVQSAGIIIPEITDFLAGKRYEDFDTITKDFTVTDLTATMRKSIKFIASRYLVISYGPAEIATNNFTYAIIYDIALKKSGKIKLNHTDCFEYVADQVEVSKENIAFLLADGSIKLLDFAVADNSEGVLILGKLQYTKSRKMTLLKVESENVLTGAPLTLTDLASLDGKTTSKVEGLETYSAENIREHVFRTTAKNHSLLYIGKFNLVSVIVHYTISGRR